ncbi:Trm112 family protein [Gemmobacter caeruleus]|uniref:Trm112 family protein n=1 Tax=Gemmobacter caeruleus TaxID=2595004 RepID=UPI0011EBBCFE|nr:Trm112 family protein [Gemmobacter caeruleus]
MMDTVTVERRMLESLVCPVTQAQLTWDAERQELISKAANLAFPVRDGIPIMLVSEARPLE